MADLIPHGPLDQPFGNSYGFFQFPVLYADEILSYYQSAQVGATPIPVGEPEPSIIEPERIELPIDDDEPVFESGSIFAPGQVWGAPWDPFQGPIETVEVIGDIVISPTESPQATVFETPVDTEEPEMAVDWGDIIGGVAGELIEGWTGVPVGGFPNVLPGQVAVPAFAPATLANTANGSAIPPGMRLDKNGKLVCKRRRRRRLLTEGDFNDLMRIATLPNKQNVAVALAKAVGRR